MLSLPASTSASFISHQLHHLSFVPQGKHTHVVTGLVTGLTGNEFILKGRGTTLSSPHSKSTILESKLSKSNEALCQLVFKTVRRSSGRDETRSDNLISSLSLVESARMGSESGGAWSLCLIRSTISTTSTSCLPLTHNFKS